uniref:Uncharacterized protein n=1 Tax=Mesocestoides corti TaxID=53468 RepID=A0A5K3FVQ7_MESCO
MECQNQPSTSHWNHSTWTSMPLLFTHSSRCNVKLKMYKKELELYWRNAEPHFTPRRDSHEKMLATGYQDAVLKTQSANYWEELSKGVGDMEQFAEATEESAVVAEAFVVTNFHELPPIMLRCSSIDTVCLVDALSRHEPTILSFANTSTQNAHRPSGRGQSPCRLGSFLSVHRLSDFSDSLNNLVTSRALLVFAGSTTTNVDFLRLISCDKPSTPAQYQLRLS